jgi:hypothetical protein
LCTHDIGATLARQRSLIARRLGKGGAERGRVTWFEVTFIVEADDAAVFHSEFDEDEIVTALPGTLAYLVSIEERPTIAESVRAKWRQLRSSD